MTSVESDIISEFVSPEIVYVRFCQQNQTVAVSSYLQGNNWSERVVAAILLIAGLPLIGILVLMIRLSSPGPGIFRQQRVGRDGRIYTMLKLRSMRCDAESKSGPVWSIAGDPRTTPLGTFLRKSHLDELPQLINVLMGEMSLVGPRPERPEFVNVLEQAVPGYCQRLRVLPGVTGLAQVNLPPDSGIDSVRRKLQLDLEYVRTADMTLDMRILLSTLLKMLFVPGAIGVRLTGARRDCHDSVRSSDDIRALTPTQLLISVDDEDGIQRLQGRGSKPR